MKAAIVISRHQERRIDGQLWSLQTSFYPFSFAARGATKLLEASNINEERDIFTLRPPDANERDFFGLSDKVQVAMLEVRRTSYDQDGQPIRVTVTIYPGDRNKFEMEAGTVPPPSTPSLAPNNAATSDWTDSPVSAGPREHRD